jgi:uncharacterized protein (TIGR02757 family)
MSLKRSYNGITAGEVKQFLEEKYLQYNNPSFIASDPISIPHSFSGLHDREISGFFASAIAWGRRDLILRSTRNLMELMENTPYEFVLSASDRELNRFNRFVHRTFSGTDCRSFIIGMRNIYNSYSSMEDVLLDGMQSTGSLRDGLSHLRKCFFIFPHSSRSEKHFADVKGGAAGKRLNMFLRINKVA